MAFGQGVLKCILVKAIVNPSQHWSDVATGSGELAIHDLYVTLRHVNNDVMRNSSKLGQIDLQIGKQHPREHGRK